jgi:hypothetical protein
LEHTNALTAQINVCSSGKQQVASRLSTVMEFELLGSFNFQFQSTFAMKLMDFQTGGIISIEISTTLFHSWPTEI